MKHAFLFPGQGSQHSGMGLSLYEQSGYAKELFESADDTLGFSISQIMFYGTDEELKQTKVTQPAIFIHSVVAFLTGAHRKADMVAGHSLGEFSALVANGVLHFEEALKLVSIRATAMQKACEQNKSGMAAILGLEDSKVEEICIEVQNETGEVVVPANYNSPGQLVISGSIKGLDIANERLKKAGAKRALMLPVSGAFHSPLMESAKEELTAAINAAHFNTASCPVYQNIVAAPVSDATQIKKNLIDQLTGPVRWTETIQNMIQDGTTQFTEVGPGKVLQGLVHKIHRNVHTHALH